MSDAGTRESEVGIGGKTRKSEVGTPISSKNSEVGTQPSESGGKTRKSELGFFKKSLNATTREPRLLGLRVYSKNLALTVRELCWVGLNFEGVNDPKITAWE